MRSIWTTNLIEGERNINGKKQRLNAITTLYANELVKAEDFWIKDIMDSQAEVDFEHSYSGLLSDVVELYSFKRWPSWFAEPEEEMRRICFSMTDSLGERHICNADTLVEYLKLEKQNDSISNKIVISRDRNKEIISRWFLKRYDFNDVIHLHLLKHLNIITFCLCVLFLLVLFEIDPIKQLMVKVQENFVPCIFGLCVLFVGGYLLELASEKKWSKLVKTRFCMTVTRITGITLFMGIPIAIIYFLLIKGIEIGGVLLVGMIVAYVLVYFLLFKKLHVFPDIHPIASLHLIFPRLVAAITAAWLTISLGFDIYVSFFDSTPQWYTAITISIVVFGFIMYEINRIMPSSSALRKAYRSLEFLVISYCISLLVGLVVINFVGDKFLERGGYLNDFYEQYVDYEGYGGLMKDNVSGIEIEVNSKLMTFKDSIRFAVNKYLEEKDENDFARTKARNLTEVYHSKNKKERVSSYPIVQRIPWGKNNEKSFFVMRDFLIMFSFIAMFWGIFIQMIFTSEKQMTEL